MPDDDRAVVQRGILEKQVAQQLIGHLRVDQRAGLEVFVQRGLALEHQQHADALTRHDLAGLHRRLDGAGLRAAVGGRVGKAQQDILSAEAPQHAPKLRLEHDDQRNHADLDDLCEDPVERIHMHHIGQPRHDQQQEDTAGHARGAGRADEQHNLIYDKSDHKNVYDIHNAEGRD